MDNSTHFNRRFLLTIVMVVILLITNLPTYAQGGDDFPTRGNRLFLEDFTTLVNRWDRLRTAKYTADYKDFAYLMDIRSPGITAWSLPQTEYDLDRYHIEVNTVIMPDSAGDSFVGVVINYQNEGNFYAFGITPAGTFEVRWWDAGVWADEPLIEGTFDVTDTILLQVRGNAGVFDVGINGRQLGTFESVELSGGQFGLFAQAGHGILQVSFDDYSVYDIGADSK